VQSSLTTETTWFGTVWVTTTEWVFKMRCFGSIWLEDIERKSVYDKILNLWYVRMLCGYNEKERKTMLLVMASNT
jgi:hypothetical protein